MRQRHEQLGHRRGHRLKRTHTHTHNGRLQKTRRVSQVKLRCKHSVLRSGVYFLLCFQSCEAHMSVAELMVNSGEKRLHVSWKQTPQQRHLFPPPEEETLQLPFPVDSSLLCADLRSAIRLKLRLHQPARAAGTQQEPCRNPAGTLQELSFLNSTEECWNNGFEYALV